MYTGRHMKKRTRKGIALLCASVIVAGTLVGCANAGAGKEIPEDSEPKVLADYVDEQVTGFIQGLENRGVSAEELAEVSPAVGYLAALVVEYRGFICIPDAEGVGGFAYLYDNAAAAIALSCAGADWYACKIADAMVYAMGHDRSFSDGRLRNAYMGGDPSDDNGWSYINGERAIKQAGHWKDGQWQEDYYAVSTATGNMAWAILALCRVAQNAPGDKAAKYLAAAEKAAGFVLSLRSETGGFTGGYEGWDDGQTRVSYKSTEHNIDIMAAFSSLAALVREAKPLEAERYREASDYARTFVLSMYNGAEHFFYTGTQDDGVTVSCSVLPLDTNTWAILALGGGLEDAGPVMYFLERNMAVGGGFDFSAGDLDGIWNEGTAHMAVCYKMMGNAAAYERVMEYLATQTAADGSITAADRDGVSTGFYVSGADVLWEYNCTTNLGATAWLAFAQMGVNPFAS